MKRILVLCLALLIVVSFGCSKDKESKEGEKVEQETSKFGMKASLIDPVSKNPVDIAKTPYSYTYNDIEFYFESEENMEAFKKNPEKYLGKRKPAEQPGQ